MIDKEELEGLIEDKIVEINDTIGRINRTLDEWQSVIPQINRLTEHMSGMIIECMVEAEGLQKKQQQLKELYEDLQKQTESDKGLHN